MSWLTRYDIPRAKVLLAVSLRYTVVALPCLTLGLRRNSTVIWQSF